MSQERCYGLPARSGKKDVPLQEHSPDFAVPRFKTYNCTAVHGFETWSVTSEEKMYRGSLGTKGWGDYLENRGMEQ